VDYLQRHSSQNLLLGGADLGQPILLAVVCSGDVMELAALEKSTELLDVEAIGGLICLKRIYNF
jgi:hypothetical protein